MRCLFPIVIFSLSMSVVDVTFAQTTTLTGIGYANPTEMRVAPGQVTTLFVTGLNLDPANPQKATSVPLPTSLAGISVTLKQSNHSYSAPLLEVQQLALCSIGGGGLTPSDCLLGAITLQIPWELSSTGDADTRAFAELVVSQSGILGKTFTVFIVADNLHVATSCDFLPAQRATQGSLVGTLSTCRPLVTHASGELVTADNPAQAGEVVVIWALGLGQTNPSVTTGQASPTPPAPLSSLLLLQFDFRINAGPSRPYVNPLMAAPIPTPAPAFVGLTPGEVGLYQINVRIPSAIPGIAACTTGVQNVSSYSTVQSNLTIDIGATTSFDGASICVQPTQ